jgi:hypothetical protein
LLLLPLLLTGDVSRCNTHVYCSLHQSLIETLGLNWTVIICSNIPSNSLFKTVLQYFIRRQRASAGDTVQCIHINQKSYQLIDFLPGCAWSTATRACLKKEPTILISSRGTETARQGVKNQFCWTGPLRSDHELKKPLKPFLQVKTC